MGKVDKAKKVDETEKEKTEAGWLFFLDRNAYRTYIIALEEEPVRRAYAFYKKRLILDAARALGEATAFVYEVDEAAWERLYATVPSMAWRNGLPFPLKEGEVLDERVGKPVLFLRGSKHERDEMPVAVISQGGWKSDGEEPPELHYTLFVEERLLESLGEAVAFAEGGRPPL
jgi:hypothetical protein